MLGHLTPNPLLGSGAAFSGTLTAPTACGSLRCRSAASTRPADYRARPGSLGRQGFPDTVAARSPSFDSLRSLRTTKRPAEGRRRPPPSPFIGGKCISKRSRFPVSNISLTGFARRCYIQTSPTGHCLVAANEGGCRAEGVEIITNSGIPAGPFPGPGAGT